VGHYAGKYNRRFPVCNCPYKMVAIPIYLLSGLFHAFAQGIISGKAYQDSRSVIYPMIMHSISNVLMVGTGYLFLLL